MQRGNVALERAVRFDSDKAALRAEALALRVDDLDVLRIELRHDHRDVRCAAMGGIVGDDRAFELGIAFFKRLDFILLHVDRAEDKVDHRGDLFGVCLGVHDDNVFERLRHRVVHVPAGADGVLVGFAGAVAAGREDNGLEPRVVRREEREALADHAGRADDTDLILFHDETPICQNFCPRAK